MYWLLPLPHWAALVLMDLCSRHHPLDLANTIWDPIWRWQFPGIYILVKLPCGMLRDIRRVGPCWECRLSFAHGGDLTTSRASYVYEADTAMGRHSPWLGSDCNDPHPLCVLQVGRGDSETEPHDPEAEGGPGEERETCSEGEETARKERSDGEG